MMRRTSRLRAHLFPAKISQWLGPLAAAGAAIAIPLIAVLALGVLDMSAAKPHPQGWADILHGVFERSVARHSRGFTPPADLASATRVAKGAAYYDRVCAQCHGAPGLGQNPVAAAMTPRPQFLPAVIGQFEDRELFWIVKRGVKYSAMPAWPAQSRDDEVWSLVAYLRTLPQQRARADGAYQPGVANEPAGDPDFRLTRPATVFGGMSAGSALTDPTSPAGQCAACHGADGAGGRAGAFPNLTILDEAYIAAQLRAYAGGKRASGFMQPVAAGLTDAGIDAVAARIAALPARRGAPAGPAPALGARIALSGIAARNIGACAGCHGIEGASRSYVSTLGGQNAAYLADQLRLFRAGGRAATGPDPMVAVAHRLSDAEIDAVAAYYAARTPR